MKLGILVLLLMFVFAGCDRFIKETFRDHSSPEEIEKSNKN